MKKYDFSKMISYYAVSFEYAERKDKKDASRQTVKGYGGKIPVKEPILPYNQGDLPAGSGQTNRNVNGDSGVIQTCDHVWYSLLKVPLGSRVYHDGEIYEVMAKDSYTDYSDITIYYLKGQTNL